MPNYPCTLKATSPNDANKTDMDYFWLLPPNASVLATAIMQHSRPEYGDFKMLADGMRSYF